MDRQARQAVLVEISSSRAVPAHQHMETTTLPDRAPAPAPMSVIERCLIVWVFLCIVVGIALGQLPPGPFQVVGRMEVARVDLPVGLLIWVMTIPMVLKVDFGALHPVKQH